MNTIDYSYKMLWVSEAILAKVVFTNLAIVWRPHLVENPGSHDDYDSPVFQNGDLGGVLNTTKSSILRGFSSVNHPAIGAPPWTEHPPIWVHHRTFWRAKKNCGRLSTLTKRYDSGKRAQTMLQGAWRTDTWSNSASSFCEDLFIRSCARSPW